MGLGVTLSNSLAGMKISQNALDVLSHNVSNSGTPGYHRRSLSVIDAMGANSTYAREGALSRTFNQSLQQHYTRAVSDASSAKVRSNYLDRLQTMIGMPGSAGSLDTVYNAFQTSLTTLSTSPDDFATRADAVQKAQILAGALNEMTSEIQSLRQEVESKISTSVDDVNSKLQALEKINTRLSDKGIDQSSRATLLDQRDRLVNSLSEQMDIRVTYRGDDTVALLTSSGVGILDGKASVFSFESGGTLSASSQFNADPDKNGVGRLTLLTPAGLTIDLVKQNVLISGELASLVELRDKTLVQAQDQLDEIAGSLAKAMSTQTSQATSLSGGKEADLTSLRNGNDFTFSYKLGGVEHKVRVVRVDDASRLPLDYEDANATRVIGLDFSTGVGNVATKLQNAIGGGIVFSNPSGNVLRIMDDGAANTSDIVSFETHSTVTGTQSGSTSLSLFVDINNSDYTDYLDGVGQRRGFAGRISVNSDVVSNNKLIVQYQTNGSLGDSSRALQLAGNLETMRFSGGLGSTGLNASFRLSGTVSDFISQTINYQGNSAEAALSDSETQTMTLDALGQRLESEYGVDVDEEMARLMELQNAFAANARVMQVVQQLMDSLMQIGA